MNCLKDKQHLLNMEKCICERGPCWMGVLDLDETAVLHIKRFGNVCKQCITAFRHLGTGDEQSRPYIIERCKLIRCDRCTCGYAYQFENKRMCCCRAILV